MVAESQRQPSAKLEEAQIKVTRVILFLNGLCEVTGRVDIGKSGSAQVSLVIPEESANDVLSSLKISSSTAKISQLPTVALPGVRNERLSIDGRSAYSTLSKLSGAEIRVRTHDDTPYEGILMGLGELKDSKPEATLHSITLDCEGQNKIIDLASVASYEFLDSDVRDQVSRALARNIESIRPESAKITTVIEGKAGATASLRYLHATNPWVMTYSLTETSNGLEIQGFAHVFNNSEVDWSETEVIVSTSTPIDFIPLVRLPQIPSRTSVNLSPVANEGPVETRRSMPKMAAFSAAGGSRGVDRSSNIALESYGGDGASFADDNAMDTMANAVDFGEFQEYKAEGAISVQAGFGTPIPVLKETLSDYTKVAYIDISKGAPAYSCISGTNSTGKVLVRGAGVISLEDRTAGKCRVPEITKDEEFFIPFRAEKRLTYSIDRTVNEQVYTALSLAGGVLKLTEESFSKQTISFINRADEALDVVVDFAGKQGYDSTLSYVSATTGELSETEGGFRLRLTVEANTRSKVIVTRGQFIYSSIVIENDGNTADTLFWRVINGNDATETYESLLTGYLEARQRKEDRKSELTRKEQRSSAANQEIVVIRENLAAIKDVAGQEAQKTAWANSLVELTDELKALKAEIAEYRELVKASDKELVDELCKLAIEWNNARTKDPAYLPLS